MMVTLVSVLVVVLLTLLVTRIATVILVSTGISQESARFQARSALSGAGFTTNESETVVAHPLRRRGVFVLGIRHDDGSYIGVPRGSHRLTDGDTPVLCGDAERLQELDDRRAAAGDAVHAVASGPPTSRSAHASRIPAR
jgi:hypothetical protein